MVKVVLIIAAALVVSNISSALADTTDQRKKRALKVIATLDSVGIAHPEVREFTDEASGRIENDGYLYLADRKMEDGRIALRFDCADGHGMQKLELSYVPKDSNYKVSATTQGVMLNYHYEFR